MLKLVDKTNVRTRRKKKFSSAAPVDRVEFDKIVCTECGSHSLNHDYGKGELVCNDCGFVLDSQQSYQAADEKEICAKKKTEKDLLKEYYGID